MARSTLSGRRRRQQSGERTVAPNSSDAAQRARLWAELTRQRALLLARSEVSLLSDEEPLACADPADQASTDFGQDLAMQVKTRTFEMLRRVERALQLMRTSRYGRCRHCGQDIPYQRLEVQSDALFCVPCLTVAEQRSAVH